MSLFVFKKSVSDWTDAPITTGKNYVSREPEKRQLLDETGTKRRAIGPAMEIKGPRVETAQWSVLQSFHEYNVIF